MDTDESCPYTALRASTNRRHHSTEHTQYNQRQYSDDFFVFFFSHCRNRNFFSEGVFSPVPFLAFLLPSLSSLLLFPRLEMASRKLKSLSRIWGNAISPQAPAGENHISSHQTRSPGPEYIRNVCAPPPAANAFID